MSVTRAYVLLFLSLLLGYGMPLYGETVDERLYRALHDAYRSPWMDTLMEQATDLGGTEAQLLLCTVLATYGSAYDQETAKLTFTSLAGAAAVVAGLKWAVNRPRPEGRTTRRNSSFPSAHAAAAFSTATLFSHRYPRYRFLFYSVASVISFSRIYLGRHYPSDVIVGGAMGYLGSKGVLCFQRDILALRVRF